MIKLLHNTALSVAGINFTVPKELLLDAGEGEVIKDNGLMFIPPEEDCLIEVSTVECDEDDNVREEFLSCFNDDTGLKVKGKVKETILKSLYTIRAEYESTREVYFEINFGRMKGYDDRLVFLITGLKGEADIEKILKRDYMKFFLESFNPADI